jgi:hypothetical protein
LYVWLQQQTLLSAAGAVLVRPGQEDPDEVEENDRDHEMGREAVDGEVLAIVMQAPLVAAAMPPRPAFPRYMRRAPAAP